MFQGQIINQQLSNKQSVQAQYLLPACVPVSLITLVTCRHNHDLPYALVKPAIDRKLDKALYDGPVCFRSFRGVLDHAHEEPVIYKLFTVDPQARNSNLKILLNFQLEIDRLPGPKCRSASLMRT